MSEHLRSDRENVIHLNPELREQGDARPQAPVTLTRLPAAMHDLRDKGRQQLQVMLRELFDRADDALFELADKANNNQDQNLYFDSMREVRIRRRAMEAAFFRQIDVAFAQLLDANAYRDDRADSAELSLDDLTLVNNDELEERVALEGMINKTNEQYAEPIQHLTMRIDHLVPVKVYQKNNPFGVDVICTAFSKDAEGVRIDVKAKLVLLKLFDNLVVSRLDKFYQALNQLLIEANILPSLKQTLKAQKAPSPARSPSQAYGVGASGALHSGNQRARDEYVARHYGEAEADAMASGGDLLHTLRDLMGTERQVGAGQSLGGEVIQSQDLVALLSRAQQRELSNVSQSYQHYQPLNLRSALKELLGDQQQQAINQVDDDVINLVSMMFEFILDDRNLASPMKVLLGRLQIPMVKVAIADKSFFGKGGHPARRLLNEMAMAALGWQEPEGKGEDALQKDSLYSRMDNMVQTILADFEADLGIFGRMLTEFRSYLDKEARRSQILEQRTLDAEDGKAKSERARAEVNAALERLLAKRAVPPAAEKLLREAWANVMFIHCLKEGVESDAWAEANASAQQLVWSVVAPMDKENRQKLLKLVPVLLKSLKEGLESIAFNPFTMTQMFKQLEQLHLARLRGEPLAVNPAPAVEAKPEPSAPAAPAPVIAPEAKQPQVAPDVAESRTAEPSESPVADREEAAVEEGTVEENAVTAEVDSAPAPAAAPEAAAETQLLPGDQHLALVANITQGSWFEMQTDAGQQYRCRLAAIIKPTGKYIFVNRTGMKVAEETREGLALALKTGRLRILDDGMLFDRALEAVIGNLKSARVVS